MRRSALGQSLTDAANSIRTLMWLFCHLLQSPETLKHVQEEIKILRSSSVPVTAAGISGRMPWLASVCTFRSHVRGSWLAVYEVLRVHSSVFALRIVKEDVVLPSSSGASTTVARGSTLLVANMSGHDDPACFEDPDEFRPNRFVQPDGTFASSQYLRVFGGGPGLVRPRDRYPVLRCL